MIENTDAETMRDVLGDKVKRIRELEAYAEECRRLASEAMRHYADTGNPRGVAEAMESLAKLLKSENEIGNPSKLIAALEEVAEEQRGGQPLKTVAVVEGSHAVGTHFDKGPWHAEIAHPQNRNPGWSVGSDDFTHDVVLYLSGDFKDDAQQRAYAEWLAGVLTRVCHSQ